MLEALKLEFQVLVSLLVWVLGMELQFFCKSTRCSQLLSHLSFFLSFETESYVVYTLASNLLSELTHLKLLNLLFISRVLELQVVATRPDFTNFFPSLANYLNVSLLKDLAHAQCSFPHPEFLFLRTLGF